MAASDPRLSFMARVAARYWLVTNGEMELEKAFGGVADDMGRLPDGPRSMLCVRPAETSYSD